MSKNSYLYHYDPHIELLKDFLDEDDCNHFIRIATSKLKRSEVMNDEGGKKVDDRRTSEHCWISTHRDKTTKRVAKAISAAVNLPLQNAESFQLVHYGIDQEYQPHYDTFDSSNLAGKEALKKGGQRLTTALLYLNDVATGGNTIFPKLSFEVPPKRGSLLVFQNCLPDSSERHPKSLHGGMPVLEGQKWVANLWFRETEFR